MTDIEEKLERLEQDLAAFRREHAQHRHTTLGDVQVGTTRSVDHGLLPNGNVDPALLDVAIKELRDNAELRAWEAIDSWTIRAKDRVGMGIVLVRMQVGYNASLWHRGKQRMFKHGASRVDALAHLAAWCQADMSETAADKEFGR